MGKLRSLIFSLGVVPLAAHHSTAPFDMTYFTEVNGKVVQFRWQNPHSYIDLEVDGKLWLLEAESLNLLTRNGWTKDTLKPGDTITCTGARAKDPSLRAMKCITVTFPDGHQMKATPLSVPTKSELEKQLAPAKRGK
ncbi:MAG: hypothetical protein RL328_727 [Acidobacteriota bacterium]